MTANSTFASCCYLLVCLYFHCSFLNSSKKSQAKTKKLFDDKISGNTQPAMKELLGLCSGRFSDNEDGQPLHNTESQNNTKEQKKNSKFDTQSKQDNMSELLGLCSGKFSDDDNDDEIVDDVLERQEKDPEQSRSEVDEEEERIDGDESDKKQGKESDDDDEESDPEEMILKRKYGKTYGTEKKYVINIDMLFIFSFNLF